MVSALSVVISAAGATSVKANLLTDPGFNTPLTNPLQGLSGILTAPFTNNVWGREVATVVASGSGITPFEGNAMLSMSDDGGVTTQAFQGTNFTAFSSDIAAGNLRANLSAYFNAPAAVSGGIGVVNIAFLDSGQNQIGPSLGSGSGPGGFDSNVATWQQLSLNNVVVPAGTVRALTQVFYSNGTMGGQPGYVDAVNLETVVVPEPGMMLGMVAFTGVAGLLRRRR